MLLGGVLDDNRAFARKPDAGLIRDLSGRDTVVYVTRDLSFVEIDGSATENRWYETKRVNRTH